MLPGRCLDRIDAGVDVVPNYVGTLLLTAAGVDSLHAYAVEILHPRIEYQEATAKVDGASVRHLIGKHRGVGIQPIILRRGESNRFNDSALVAIHGVAELREDKSLAAGIGSGYAEAHIAHIVLLYVGLELHNGWCGRCLHLVAEH